MFSREELTQEQRQRCIRLLRASRNNRLPLKRYTTPSSEIQLEQEEAVAVQLSRSSDVACCDAGVVMEAIKLSGQSLEFAHAKFRNDKKYVREALKQNGTALQFASSELQEDRQLVLD